MNVLQLLSLAKQNKVIVKGNNKGNFLSESNEIDNSLSGLIIVSNSELQKLPARDLKTGIPSNYPSEILQVLCLDRLSNLNLTMLFAWFDELSLEDIQDMIEKEGYLTSKSAIKKVKGVYSNKYALNIFSFSPPMKPVDCESIKRTVLQAYQYQFKTLPLFNLTNDIKSGALVEQAELKKIAGLVFP